MPVLNINFLILVFAAAAIFEVISAVLLLSVVGLHFGVKLDIFHVAE